MKTEENASYSRSRDVSRFALGSRTALALLCCWTFGLVGFAAEPRAPRVAPSQAALDVRVEAEKIAAARAAAGRDDERIADAALITDLSPRAEAVPSVTLARRAAGVCGWLQNDNEHARAERLARRVINRLATMTEDDSVDRAERLYWEAWLEGYVLDHKARALELLQSAERLVPDDPRVIEDQLRWAQALAEFGR